MTEWQAIHQFEYRWQPNIDLSLIAGSLEPAQIRRWSDRIGQWVRHPLADAPSESVRYEIFSDQMVALAWRQRNAQALGLEDGAEGRPEVSRVLVAPIELLPPEAAMGVCHKGLPEAIGPRPGSVAVNGALPPVDPAEMISLVHDNAAELDELACGARGLYRVIAAALTDLDLALAVQLPERVIHQRPQSGSQGPLLWGLWRVLGPLLGSGMGRRGWSFSTFEPPLGNVDTGALPDIVFRRAQPVQPALNTRRETLVRPEAPAEPRSTILYQEFAWLLVDAYKHLGGENLGRHLDAVAGDYQTVEGRVAGVQDTLYAALPPAALSAPPHQRYVAAADPAITAPEEEEDAAAGNPAATDHAATPAPSTTWPDADPAAVAHSRDDTLSPQVAAPAAAPPGASPPGAPPPSAFATRAPDSPQHSSSRTASHRAGKTPRRSCPAAASQGRPRRRHPGPSAVSSTRCPRGRTTRDSIRPCGSCAPGPFRTCQPTARPPASSCRNAAGTSLSWRNSTARNSKKRWKLSSGSPWSPISADRRSAMNSRAGRAARTRRR